MDPITLAFALPIVDDLLTERPIDARPLEMDETVTGEIVAIENFNNQPSYVLETEEGEHVRIPRTDDMDFEKGEFIEATRTEHGYEVYEADYGMEM